MIDPNNPIRREMECIYSAISPFELKDKLLSFATERTEKSTLTLLNAGRGNSNWISTSPCQYFFTLGQFEVEESIRTHYEEPVLRDCQSSRAATSAF
ncbi:hypothetical protein [Paenibacillus sp. 1001270B_150601_E10]|uniref:hypothetical protein n=1 Tax=Paenibacillus sp. 1001270B_150601_E10 TaxID=2787079 RepID=UPI001E4C0C01|nr:hypothetical protein [Paenibacillus sp. 1001270B_150601_E10]